MKVNPKHLKKVIVKRALYSSTGLENGTKLAHPKAERKYMKVLAQCLDFQTVQELYPGIDHPICRQLRDLCRLGYLDRYALTVKTGLRGQKPYFYRTTQKGVDLLVASYNSVKIG